MLGLTNLTTYLIEPDALVPSLVSSNYQYNLVVILVRKHGLLIHPNSIIF